jgi:hypothetical protein
MNAAGTAAGPNSTGAVYEIQKLLADRGCDVTFRGLIAHTADPKLVKKICREFDRRKAQIKNPGGWLRERFKRAGVEGLEGKPERARAETIGKGERRGS